MYYKPNQSPKIGPIFCFLITDESQRVHSFNQRARLTSWWSPKRSSSEVSNHSGLLAHCVATNKVNVWWWMISKKCQKSFSSNVYKRRRILLNQALETGKRWESTTRQFSPNTMERGKKCDLNSLAKGNDGYSTLAGALFLIFGFFLERAEMRGWNHLSNTVIWNGQIKKTPARRGDSYLWVQGLAWSLQWILG